MLFNRRKRLERLAEEERQGKSFWTSTFAENVRARMFHAYNDASSIYTASCAERARGLILRDEGKFYLVDGHMQHAEDFFQYLMSCDDADMPMAVEAMDESLRRETPSGVKPWLFQQRMDEILRESRISFELINGQMVEFASREMHVEVVAPTLKLLAGDRKFDKVEAAYQDALNEISHNRGDDAITDAGTALQELLTTLGCSGNALGPLIKSARSIGLISAHDVRLLDGLSAVMHWVSADRSETGDAHSVSKASVDDAWLTVHVVGALILRLTKNVSRG